ncbi:MAG: prepilin peptidase [Candidatus Eremiobacteraeota bacterium]|nr:prepilin peptidase [Candidatus Eremiobacteraeota bacterium]
MSVALAFVLAATLIAAVADVRTQRIPNTLTISLAAASLIVNACIGWQALTISLGLLIATLVIGTVAFSARLIGGGDVKLIAASVAALGVGASLWFLLYTFVAGGVIAITLSAWRRSLPALFSNVRALAIPVFVGLPTPRTHGERMPYGVAIFVGTLALAIQTHFLPNIRI